MLLLIPGVPVKVSQTQRERTISYRKIKQQIHPLISLWKITKLKHTECVRNLPLKVRVSNILILLAAIIKPSIITTKSKLQSLGLLKGFELYIKGPNNVYLCYFETQTLDGHFGEQ